MLGEGPERAGTISQTNRDRSQTLQTRFKSRAHQPRDGSSSCPQGFWNRISVCRGELCPNAAAMAVDRNDSLLCRDGNIRSPVFCSPVDEQGGCSFIDSSTGKGKLLELLGRWTFRALS